MERSRSNKVPCLACGKETSGHVNDILLQKWGEFFDNLPHVPLCPRCQLLSGFLSDSKLLENFDITPQEISEQKWQIEVAVRAWCIQSRKVLEASALSANNVRRSTSRRSKSDLPKIRKRPRKLTQHPKTEPASETPEWKILRPRAGRVWTEAEDTELRNELLAGLRAEDIAMHMGRGKFSVEVRAVKLGLQSMLR